MAAGEGIETLGSIDLISSEASLDSLTALHGLLKIVSDLDSRRREEMLRLITTIELMPYEAPEGHVIKAYPMHTTSREVPLAVERFGQATEEWTRLVPGGEPYNEAVRYSRGGFDVYFLGRTVEKASGQIAPYVYSDDRTTRVEANRHTRFIERPITEG